MNEAAMNVGRVLSIVSAQELRAQISPETAKEIDIYLCLRGIGGDCLVCAPRTMEVAEVIRQTRLIEGREWVLSTRTCVDRDTNPCDCVQSPDRQHWLLEY